MVLLILSLWKKEQMERESWKTISIKEKFQIINGTLLIVSAIILYFLSFIITLTIGMGVISAGATLLATGLAFFGITGYIKSQMLDFQTKMREKVDKEIEEIQMERKKENEEHYQSE